VRQDKFEEIERQQFGKDGYEDAVAQIGQNRASAQIGRPRAIHRAAAAQGMSSPVSEQLIETGVARRRPQIPDPRNVPAEEWDPSGLVRLALEFGCQLINNQRSPLGCD
jgi:hypothetical protein